MAILKTIGLRRLLCLDAVYVEVKSTMKTPTCATFVIVIFAVSVSSDTVKVVIAVANYTNSTEVW